MQNINYIFVFSLLLLLCGISFAQIPEGARLIGSTSSAVIVVDEVGSPLNSTNNKLVITGDSVFGFSNSSSTRVCIGYLCVEFGPSGEILSVTFLLDLNVNGTSGDVAYADTNTTPGYYSPKNLQRFFVCVEDPSSNDNPTIGIVHGGTQPKYIRLDPGSSYMIRLAQKQSGNKFVIPVTSGGCNIVRDKFPIVFPLTPFGLPTNLINTVELILNYPFDLKGDFERTGAFTLVLEKNESQIKGEVK